MEMAEAILDCLLITAENKIAKGQSEEKALKYVRSMLMILDNPDSLFYRSGERALQFIPPEVTAMMRRSIFERR